MRVAIVKPDFSIRGGFELVVERLVRHLEAQDHDVRVLTFDAWSTDRRPFGVRVPDTSWGEAPEFFTYMSQVEKVRQFDLTRADLVISTQPPSFLAEHSRHLALFFHHARMYYDLSDVMLEAGLVDARFHEDAVRAVRAVDAPGLEAVRWYAAGSEEVARRLAEFNGRSDRLNIFHAGASLAPSVVPGSRVASPSVLCVSRHDFPKRTELFVQSAFLNPHIPARAVGTGGLYGAVRQLAADFANRILDPATDSRALWCKRSEWIDPTTVDVPASTLELSGHVTDDTLDQAYASAVCVVAPALLEDYGLTALEAMSYGKPVVTCSDGGHLGNLVEDGVTGFVVEPTGQAIADAVARLWDDRDLAARMGEAGREHAAAFTWSRALGEFDAAIEAAMS